MPDTVLARFRAVAQEWRYSDALTPEIVGEAMQRYYHDAEFHARVTWAVQLSRISVSGLEPLPHDRTTVACSIALVLAERDPMTGLRKEPA